MIVVHVSEPVHSVIYTMKTITEMKMSALHRVGMLIKLLLCERSTPHQKSSEILFILPLHVVVSFVSLAPIFIKIIAPATLPLS